MTTISEEDINKIHCIDCMEGFKKIPNQSVDLLLTDPPYGISRELNCKGKRLGTTAKLDFNFGDWDKLNTHWVEEALQKTKGWAIIFCAKKDIGKYWELLENKGFIAIDALVWQKPDPIPLNGKSKFLNAWETAIIGKRNGAHWDGYCTHNIIKCQAPKGKERIHPTQKPLKLFQELIKLTTKENQLVLDPFMGSGTTAVAAKLLGRNFVGFEIDQTYCKLANERLKNTEKSLLKFTKN
jgi:DNA modification methylase